MAGGGNAGGRDGHASHLQDLLEGARERITERGILEPVLHLVDGCRSLGVPIFFTRPIALVLFLIAAVLLSLSLLALIRKHADWRAKLAQAEAGEAAQ